ncbi:hypothetical protein EYC80_008461 [Monilinia laxa]|uniref:LIM zinc-binding domain-containing protein n=1 Tax=Monilinia laxa TaxID=61186 RepID=A0A5N6JQB6_MONLA|nr:hypothetical protein EYC80_008461 [Monilinia laxa]
MADIMRSSSFLPTIKCSSCARDIQIAMMGEHLCSGSVPAGEITPPPHLHTSLDQMPHHQQPYFDGPSLLKPGRTMPPRVDTSAANRPYFPQDQLTPASSTSHSRSASRSASPLTPHDRLRLPFEKSSRVNEPTPNQRPPTPTQLTSNLDSAFPRFPTPKGAGSPRIKNVHASPSPRFEPADPLMYAPLNAKIPTSSRIPTNAASLPKIDTTTQAAFATNYQMAPNPKDGPVHHRSFTVGRMNDILSPPLSGEPERFDRTLSRVSGHSRSSTNISSSNFPMPPRGKGYGALGPSSWMGDEIQGYPRPDAMRSHTFPRRNESLDLISPRNPSISSNSHGRHVSNDRGRKKSFSGPDTSRALPPQGASLIRGRSGHKAGDIPPLPNINLEAEFGANNPYHSSSDSVSSIHSYHSIFSQGSKASSRSSPPSESDYHRRQESTSRMSDLMSEITSSMANISPNNDMYPRPGDLEPVKEQEPYSPLSPAFPSSDYATHIAHRPSPAHRVPSPAPLRPYHHDPTPAPLHSQSRNRSPTTLNDIPRSHTAPPSDLNKPPPDARSPPTSKGNCKACTLPIKGKSISSADGRLTGRYHKSCFVCTTCQSSFQTAEFYVHGDAPYCEHHYHQLNNSMCHGCDRGIEGQYLESEKREKFHPTCLNCADCQRNLQNDYFEMGGKIYCERDAFRRAQEGKKRTGDMGGIYGVETTKMERRTTRLMMM